MNSYSIATLICAIISAALGLFIYCKNRKSLFNITFALLCLTTLWWQVCWFFLFSVQKDSIAAILVKIGYSGIIFIPIAFFHFSLEFNQARKRKSIAVVSYILGLAFLVLLWFTDFFISGFYKYSWGYYPKAGILHPFYLIFLICLVVYSAVLYVSSIRNKNLSGIRRYQSRYLLIALAIYSLAISDFIVNYGFQFYPVGFYFVISSLGIIAYAIARYKLMNITVTITRTSIFVTLYTLVLGLPFLLATLGRVSLVGILGIDWWTGPLVLMAALATAGPFVYIFLEKRAIAIVLREQRRYQETLKHAAVGMTRIRNLEKLLKMIVYILTKTVRLTHAAIYLFDPETAQFVLKAGRNLSKKQLIPAISNKSSLIIWLQHHRQPMVFEEVRRIKEDNPSPILREWVEQMQLLNASLLVPSFLEEDRLLGFLVLGDKRSGAIYTPEDLNVFSVLASQAALAIENALFILEAKIMQEQISHAEKMATIGTMADGLSHQINNRFHALSMIAGDTMDTLKLTKTENCSDEVKRTFGEIKHALERLQANVMQGKEVVSGLLKYSRKGDTGFSAVSIDEVIDGSLEMVKFKVNLSEIDFVRNYPSSLFKVKANLTQLQEVFFNLIDNAYDAIVEHKQILKTQDYRGKITVSCQEPADGFLIISFADNGIGLKKENRRKVFTPFFTTKVSSRGGTGLGLFVIQRIITQIHRGRIRFESDYGKGTRFILELPVAK